MKYVHRRKPCGQRAVFAALCARIDSYQALGDACVVAAIEHLGGKDASIPAGSSFRNVLEKVNELEARSMAVEPDQNVAPVFRNLSGLTPMGRQAFLLIAMEEFSLQDAALVLEMTQEDVSLLLEDANQDISAQLATDVVIIEDEPLVA